jgi:hypothetical protein
MNSQASSRLSSRSAPVMPCQRLKPLERCANARGIIDDLQIAFAASRDCDRARGQRDIGEVSP